MFLTKNGVFWVVTPCGSCKSQEPHGVTTQKIPFFIVTAVKTSNLTYVSNINHTNVIIIGAPPRYDAQAESHLTNSSKLFNNKLSKFTRISNRVTMCEMPTNRLLYTKHGLHLNTSGKKILSNKLVSLIFRVLEKVEVKPIMLKWYDRSTLMNNKPSGSQSSIQPSVKRIRKVPVTRNKDFLWNA
jgi:hypothetical protein